MRTNRIRIPISAMEPGGSGGGSGRGGGGGMGRGGGGGMGRGRGGGMGGRCGGGMGGGRNQGFGGRGSAQNESILNRFSITASPPVENVTRDRDVQDNRSVDLPGDDLQSMTEDKGKRATAVIHRETCTGCGVCVDVCPNGAISLQNGLAQVRDDVCTGCGTCVPPCPAGAIALV